MNIKRIVFISIVLLCYAIIPSTITHTENPTEKKYPLKIPSIVDGTPFGINGYEIKKMIFIMKEIEKIIHGTLNPSTKQRKGKYSLREHFYTIEELIAIEKNIHTFDKHMELELEQVLNQAQEDFIKINEPYLEQAQSGKLVTLKLMDEWAINHNRKESYILDWAKEEPGHEFDSFRKNALSLDTFYLFCNDLISFLSDLILSCPRGWQQFIELQEKKSKQTP